MQTVRCNYCAGTKYKTILAGHPYTIVQCLRCDLAFLSPQPSKQELFRLYNDGYFENADVGTGYSSYADITHDLEREAVRRLAYIQKYIQKGQLLDAGCGYGTFLVRAKTYGFSVSGCDISRDASRELKKKNISVVTADIGSKKFPKGPFDVITAWDVIEHVTDPMLSFKAFFNSQARGGYIFMTTPDLYSADAKLLGKKWYGFKRIPEHIYYFTPATIRNYLHKAGYETVDIRPWGFQRNLAYCIDQLGRYNTGLQRMLQPVSKALGFQNISLYFPFIDMMVAARKL